MNFQRRGFIRSIGVLAASSAASKLPAAEHVVSPENLERLTYPVPPYKANVSRTLTAVVVGCGARGSLYASYATTFPDCLKIVGVCDIDAFKVSQFKAKYSLPEDAAFVGDCREYPGFEKKLADIMIVALPDELHFGPAMKAMDMGYDLLLEKPMARTEEECRALLVRQEKTGRLVGIEHVLRYSPYFCAMRQAVRDGLIGELVSVQHLEPIGYAHMSHSYVRGNWPNSKTATPIILAKSCHDLDIIKWIVGRPCKQVSAEGSLTFFRRENCPKGAPLRCIEGCPHEKNCPYSALKIYSGFSNGGPSGWNYYFNIEHLKNDPAAYDAALERWLRTTNYGKCVFQCDNDQCDHYVAELLFEGGVTAAFSMEAFTPWSGRRTRIFGTTGYIEGDGKTFKVYDFKTGRAKIWDNAVVDDPRYRNHGHGGGDHALVRDLLEAVDGRNETRLSSSVCASVESHLMGFACEKSRLSGMKVKIDL